MNRRLTVLAVMTMMLGLLAVPGASAFQSGETVRIRGENDVNINRRIESTLRFHDKAKVASGDTVTWVREENTGEPHTITLAEADALPEPAK